jgi:hypothetical protein
MTRLIVTGVLAGLLFAILDGVMHANPLARRLYAVYKPLARDSVNAPLGIAIDLLWGLAMAWIFTLLAPALPGDSGWRKGLSFGLLAWFLRVLMPAAGHAMMLRLPVVSVFYTATAGLAEMLLLGLIYGLALWPARLALR